MPYKKTGVKKLSRDAEKTPIFVHRGLRYANKKFKFASKYFLENVCLSTKFDLRLKKKRKNYWGNFNFTWKFSFQIV